MKASHKGNFAMVVYWDLHDLASCNQIDSDRTSLVGLSSISDNDTDDVWQNHPDVWPTTWLFSVGQAEDFASKQQYMADLEQVFGYSIRISSQHTWQVNLDQLRQDLLEGVQLLLTHSG